MESWKARIAYVVVDMTTESSTHAQFAISAMSSLYKTSSLLRLVKSVKEVSFPFAQEWTQSFIMNDCVGLFGSLTDRQQKKGPIVQAIVLESSASTGVELDPVPSLSSSFSLPASSVPGKKLLLPARRTHGDTACSNSDNEAGAPPPKQKICRRVNNMKATGKLALLNSYDTDSPIGASSSSTCVHPILGLGRSDDDGDADWIPSESGYSSSSAITKSSKPKSNDTRNLRVCFDLPLGDISDDVQEDLRRYVLVKSGGGGPSQIAAGSFVEMKQVLLTLRRFAGCIVNCDTSNLDTELAKMSNLYYFIDSFVVQSAAKRTLMNLVQKLKIILRWRVSKLVSLADQLIFNCLSRNIAELTEFERKLKRQLVKMDENELTTKGLWIPFSDLLSLGTESIPMNEFENLERTRQEQFILLKLICCSRPQRTAVYQNMLVKDFRQRVVEQGRSYVSIPKFKTDFVYQFNWINVTSCVEYMQELTKGKADFDRVFLSEVGRNFTAIMYKKTRKMISITRTRQIWRTAASKLLRKEDLHVVDAADTHSVITAEYHYNKTETLTKRKNEVLLADVLFEKMKTIIFARKNQTDSRLE